MMYKIIMIRTQIYLTELQIKTLKQQAFTNEVTLSQAIRDLIEKEFFAPKQSKKRKNIGDVLLGMAKEAKAMHAKGPKDLASKTDRYLYGEDAI